MKFGETFEIEINIRFVDGTLSEQFLKSVDSHSKDVVNMCDVTFIYCIKKIISFDRIRNYLVLLQTSKKANGNYINEISIIKKRNSDSSQNSNTVSCHFSKFAKI